MTDVSPGGKQRRWTSPEVFDRQVNLPYGIWITADGREVLFNRFYEPLWQRKPGQPVEPADPTEWIADVKTRSWFYTDAETEAARRAAASKGLETWQSSSQPGARQ